MRPGLLPALALLISCDPQTTLSVVVPIGSAQETSAVDLSRFAATIRIEVVDTGPIRDFPLGPGLNTLEIEIPSEEASRLRVSLLRPNVLMATAEQTTNPGGRPAARFRFPPESIADTDEDGIDDVTEILSGGRPDTPDLCAPACSSGALCCESSCLDAAELAFSSMNCGGCGVRCSFPELCIAGRCEIEEVSPLGTVLEVDGPPRAAFAGGPQLVVLTSQESNALSIYRVASERVELEETFSADQLAALPNFSGPFDSGAVNGEWLALVRASPSDGTYLFRRQGGVWGFTQQIIGAGGAAAFGGETLVLLSGGDGDGSADSYTLALDTWELQSSITLGRAIGSTFSGAMDASENVLAITFSEEDNSGDLQPGALRVYARDGDLEDWGLVGTALGSESQPGGERFGTAVSVAPPNSVFGNGSSTSFANPLVLVSARGADFVSANTGLGRPAAGRIALYEVASSALITQFSQLSLNPTSNGQFGTVEVIDARGAVFVDQERVVYSSNLGSSGDETLLTGGPSPTIDVGQDFLAIVQGSATGGEIHVIPTGVLP